MKHIKHACRIVAVCILFSCLSAPLQAKVAAGISGIVTDPEGAVVPERR